MPKKEPLVSVIVPVYNAEKFLRKCIDSILAQSLDQLEIICVNDGSTDGSGKILDEYRRRYARLHVLTKSNGGLVSARKAGVAAASGAYIGFVDADDWIESKMYERLYEAASRANADIVTSGYVQEGNYVSVSYDNVDEGVYSDEMIPVLRDYAIFNLQKCDKGIIASVCSKLFETNMLKDVILKIPDEIAISEDKLTVLTFLLQCRRAVVLREAYYHYVMHRSSMMHSADTQYLVRVNHVFQYLRGLYMHPNFTEGMRIQAELYVTQYIIKGINTWLGFQNPNLMWIDPYWMDSFPDGTKVAIYGGGELGKKYHQQIVASKKFEFAGCIDFGYERMHGYPFEVWSPQKLLTTECDILVITIKDSVVADQIREQLISLGIDAEKIRWFEQKEIFWKFAKADGLLD